MRELNCLIEGALARGLQATPAAEFLNAARALARPPATNIADEIRIARTTGHGLVKVSSQGERLTVDADSWAAIHDDATGLLWSRDNVGGKRLSWSEAKGAAESYSLCDFGDWRLPTIKELLTLVDYERHEPAIDTRFFPECQSNWYWTSTPAAYSPADHAWGVSFSSGVSDWSYHGSSGFVRAVRASQ